MCRVCHGGTNEPTHDVPPLHQHAGRLPCRQAAMQAGSATLVRAVLPTNERTNESEPTATTTNSSAHGHRHRQSHEQAEQQPRDEELSVIADKHSRKQEGQSRKTHRAEGAHLGYTISYKRAAEEPQDVVDSWRSMAQMSGRMRQGSGK